MRVHVWPGAAFVMSCRRLLAPVQAAAARFPSVYAAACGACYVAVRAVLGSRLSCGSLFVLTKNKCFDLSQKNSFLMQKTK
jgi:hypothetical protein